MFPGINTFHFLIALLSKPTRIFPCVYHLLRVFCPLDFAPEVWFGPSSYSFQGSNDKEGE